MHRACLVLVGIAPLACSDRTRVEVDIAAPGLTLSSLELAVGWDGHTQHVTSLPPGGGAPKLPGSVLLVLPDVAKKIDVTVEAVDDVGVMLSKSDSVESRPRQQVSLAITLEKTVADLAMPVDLSQPIDLSVASEVDLASTDFASVDLQSSSDLLPPADLAPHNPLVQLGAVTTGGATLTASLPAVSRAGTLLVFTNAFDKGTDPSGPNGWTYWAGDSTANNSTLWYLANNPGGVTSVSATVAGATASVGQVSEWDTVTAADVGAWCWNSNQVTSLTCTTNSTTHVDLALESVSHLLSAAATTSFSPNGSYLTLADNAATSTKLHYQFGYALTVPSAAPASSTVSSGSAGTWAGVLVTFH